MDAKSFFEKFTNRIYSSKYIIEKYWKTDYSTFTEFIMTHIIDEIIKGKEEKEEAEEYMLSHEYFRIDASGWISNSDDIQHEAKKLDLIPHLWDLKIAVEHENNRFDWTDEVIKLMHIRCPLKIVIGYNHSEHRDDESKSDNAKIGAAIDWMQKVDAFKQVSEDEEFLIILGNAGKQPPNENDPCKSIDYRGYLIKKDAEKGCLNIAARWT